MKKTSNLNVALTIFGVNFALSPIFSINIDLNPKTIEDLVLNCGGAFL